MDWNPFSSQSAPEREPGMGYLAYPASRSVPERYNSTGYQINGFTIRSQVNEGVDQLPQPLPSNQFGPGTHPQRQVHHLPLGHSTNLNNHIMAMYAQGQPLGLFGSHHLAYQDTRGAPNTDNNYQTFPPPPGHDFDMEEIYDHGTNVHGRPSASHSHQFPAAMSEGTYLTYSHSSPVNPLPVPAPLSPFTATPEYSLPGSSLSINPPHIHERYMDHRLATTSGDLRTTGSVLFAEDAPPPKRKPPSKINHYVTVQPLPQLERDNSPMRSIQFSSTLDEAAGPRQSSETPGTPVPEGGIENFCMRSFPHNTELREALQAIMNSKTAESQDLYQFLKNEASTNKPWECRFEGDSGQCGQRFRRRDLALGHIRQVHIKMLPVPCNGDCGDPKCSRWFSSAATKSSHARKGSIKCDKCNILTSGRNISRHQGTRKCQGVAAAIANPRRGAGASIPDLNKMALAH